MAACDSGLVDSLLPMDDVGPPDEGPVIDPDAAQDRGLDASPIDRGPDEGVVDAGPDTAADARGDVMLDGAVDASGDAAVDASADASPRLDAMLADLAVDADPPLPDVGPDLGMLCVDDGDCDGVCADDGRCRPCVAAGECPGQRCEDGVCLGCRGAEDCDSRLCLDGFCQPCGLADQCAAGEGCAEQRCGACGVDGDCRAGEVCVGGGCIGCDPADHRGCGADELCCPGEGGPACAATDPAAQCAACGVACEADGADGCVGRACVCGEGDACAGAAPFCIAEQAEPVCAECRGDDDCGGGFVCATGACLPATVVDVLGSEPELEAMLEFVGLAGRLDDLRARQAVTIFAPVNETFDALSGGCINGIIRDGVTFVRHHTFRSREVLPYAVLLEITDGAPDGVPLLMESNDEAVAGRAPDGRVTLDGAPILRSIPAANGVVHVIGGHILLTGNYGAGCDPAP